MALVIASGAFLIYLSMNLLLRFILKNLLYMFFIVTLTRFGDLQINYLSFDIVESKDLID